MSERHNEKSKKPVTTKKIVYVAILSAFMCIVSPFAIPVGTVPMTLAILAVFLAAGITGRATGTLVVLVYLIIGAVGVPVFSSFSSGIHMLAGPTGGYLLGYLPCAYITGLFADKFRKSSVFMPLGMSLGLIACYITGTVWFVIGMEGAGGILGSITTCVLPFIPADVLKIIAASTISPILRRSYNSMQIK